MPDNKWARLLAYVTGLINRKLLSCYEDGCRMDLAANAGLNDSRGLFKRGRGHPGSLGIIHGNQRLRKQKSDPKQINMYVYR